MTDRAQSEVFGFASVFAVVMLMLLLVSAAAYPGLREATEYRTARNVELGMESVADNVDDQIREGVPGRTTRLRLAGGHLTLGAPVTVTVSGSSFSESFAVRPLVYRSGEGTEIVYSNGAVIRDDGEGVATIREPGLLASDEGVVLPVVRLAPGPGPAGKGGTTAVRTTRGPAEVAVARGTTVDLTVSVDSPRREAWRRILEPRPGVACSLPGNGTVTCEVRAERVYVTSVPVEVRFG